MTCALTRASLPGWEVEQHKAIGLAPCALARLLLALLSFDRPAPADVWPRRAEGGPGAAPRDRCSFGTAARGRRTRSRDERPGRTPARRYAPAERRRQGGQGSSAKRTPLSIDEGGLQALADDFSSPPTVRLSVSSVLGRRGRQRSGAARSANSIHPLPSPPHHAAGR